MSRLFVYLLLLHVVVVIDFSKISPVVLIESSISFAEQPWEAILWHNSDGNTKWNGLELKLISDPPTVSTMCFRLD